jgi:hypothetical protein
MATTAGTVCTGAMSQSKEGAGSLAERWRRQTTSYAIARSAIGITVDTSVLVGR